MKRNPKQRKNNSNNHQNNQNKTTNARNINQIIIRTKIIEFPINSTTLTPKPCVSEWQPFSRIFVCKWPSDASQKQLVTTSIFDLIVFLVWFGVRKQGNLKFETPNLYTVFGS